MNTEREQRIRELASVAARAKIRAESYGMRNTAALSHEEKISLCQDEAIARAAAIDAERLLHMELHNPVVNTQKELVNAQSKD